MTDSESFDIGRKVLYYMVAGFIMTFLVLGMVILIAGYKEKLVQIPQEIEAKVLTSRFINSPDCFVYQDSITDRSYSRLIEDLKFTKENLARCYTSLDSNYFEFQLTLIDKSSKERKTLQTQEWYNVPVFTIKEPVQIKYENGISDGELQILVQNLVR